MPILVDAALHGDQAGMNQLDSLFHYLRSGAAPPAGWPEAQTAILHDAENPHEMADFVVLARLQKLVEAVSASKPH